jgi:hypothetical protein
MIPQHGRGGLAQRTPAAKRKADSFPQTTSIRQTCQHKVSSLVSTLSLTFPPQHQEARYINRHVKMAHYANWRLPLFLVSLLISLGIAQDDTTTAAAGDPSVLISEIARASNQSLLWGPYKPNLYFGVRPRIPKSLSAGLLWAKVDNFQDVQGSECSLFAGVTAVR